MTGSGWQALQDGFDTRQLLDAVDDVDTLRGTLGDIAAKRVREPGGDPAWVTA